ncbi:hypothetical protein PENTCL1PPCAC_25336, partial [Pristionchus entomophagus]
FHIMGLPTQLISNSISFLEMEDRLRARVNKRLDAIELNCKYHVEKMIIEESEQEGNIDEEDEDEDENDDQRITFYKEKSYSSDCIRRLTQNVSIGCLKIKLTGSKEFHREIFNLLTEFDIRDLYLDSKSFDHALLREIMVDSFFLDLTKACKSLFVHDCENISAECLHQVYKNMMDSSTKLRKFFTDFFSVEKCISFLKLILITFRNGVFFSNRDIEVRFVYQCCTHIVVSRVFDGYMEIYFFYNHCYNTYHINLKIHETRESLEETKNREIYAIIEVFPE